MAIKPNQHFMHLSKMANTSVNILKKELKEVDEEVGFSLSLIFVLLDLNFFCTQVHV